MTPDPLGPHHYLLVDHPLPRILETVDQWLLKGGDWSYLYSTVLHPSPLEMAFLQGSPDLIKGLLLRGIPQDPYNFKGDPAFFSGLLPTAKNRMDCLKAYQEAGGSFHWTSELGMDAMKFAFIHFSDDPHTDAHDLLEIVDLLLEAGFDLNALDAQGRFYSSYLHNASFVLIHKTSFLTGLIDRGMDFSLSPHEHPHHSFLKQLHCFKASASPEEHRAIEHVERYMLMKEEQHVLEQLLPSSASSPKRPSKLNGL